MGMWGGHVDDEGAEVEGDQQGNKGGGGGSTKGQVVVLRKEAA